MNSSVNNAYWYLKWLQSNKSVPPQGCLQTMMQNIELIQSEYSSSRFHLSLLHTLPKIGTTPSSSHNCFSNVAWARTISHCQKTSSRGKIGYFWGFFCTEIQVCYQHSLFLTFTNFRATTINLPAAAMASNQRPAQAQEKRGPLQSWSETDYNPQPVSCCMMTLATCHDKRKSTFAMVHDPLCGGYFKRFTNSNSSG